MDGVGGSYCIAYFHFEGGRAKRKGVACPKARVSSVMTPESVKRKPTSSCFPYCFVVHVEAKRRKMVE